MNTSDQTPELMLELNYEDRRSQLFRLVTDEGIIMYYEESDIPDLNRPVGLENSVPLYYSLESAWKAISAFVSQTRFNNRLSWHEASCDWLQLKPSYVHTLIRPFIMRSLSEQTRKTESLLQSELDGLRNWINRTSSPSPLQLNTQPANTARHEYAKRA